MKPFTNLRMNMCIDTFAIIHIYIYLFMSCRCINKYHCIPLDVYVFIPFYMCVGHWIYQNILNSPKFQQYRIPVISIASARCFFTVYFFYSTMFFPHRLMTWCLYYHNFICCPECVWMAESAFHIQSHLPSMAHNGRRGLNAACEMRRFGR